MSWSTLPPAKAEWSLLIVWADALTLPQPRLHHSQIQICIVFNSDRLGGGREAPGTCISFSVDLFLTWLEIKPRDSHMPGKCSATDLEPSDKQLYFQSVPDEVDAAGKVSHAVRSAD